MVKLEDGLIQERERNGVIRKFVNCLRQPNRFVLIFQYSFSRLGSRDDSQALKSLSFALQGACHLAKALAFNLLIILPLKLVPYVFYACYNFNASTSFVVMHLH